MIVYSLVEELVDGGVIQGKTVAMDATFINAYSKRDPFDDSRGYFDDRDRSSSQRLPTRTRRDTLRSSLRKPWE